MSYTTKNFKTKKELKAALAKGEKITIFNPGLGGTEDNGTAYLEGPHFPKPHTWYAEVEMRDGIVFKIRS